MSDDRNYYIQRAEEELEIAQTSTEPAAVKAHYMLAGFYLDRAYGSDGETEDASDTDPIAKVGPPFIARSTSARPNA